MQETFCEEDLLIDGGYMCGEGRRLSVSQTINEFTILFIKVYFFLADSQRNIIQHPFTLRGKNTYNTKLVEKMIRG